MTDILSQISYNNSGSTNEEKIDIVVSADGDDIFLPSDTSFMSIENQYQQIMFFYEAGIQQITAKLQILNNEFKFGNDRNPIENIKSRVKSIDSITKKMKRKNIPLTLNNMMLNLHDIAGVRVICPFISDVYSVANMLTSQQDVTLIEVKDYIKNPKPNGYRSLHLIIMVDVYFSDHKAQVPVEMQFRTIAMNFWASTEHQLRYKKDVEFTDEMHNELRRCSELMAEADERMQKLAEQLPSFEQTEVSYSK